MTDFFTHTARAFRQTARGIGERPLVPLVSLGTLSIALLITGVVGLVAWNLVRLTERWAETGHMSVYLDDDISPSRAMQITDAVRHLPGVNTARLVPSKEAYLRLRTALGSRGNLLDGVEDSFLPSSIEAQLQSGAGEHLRSQPAFVRLARVAGVEDIDLHEETTQRLFGLRSMLVRGAIGFSLLVALGALYLVAASIRLGIDARRDEVAILRLVGATESFVRAPFLLEGAVIGLLGASIAGAGTWTIFHFVAPALSANLSSWLQAGSVCFFPSQAITIGILSGGAIGLLGALLAFSRASRG